MKTYFKYDQVALDYLIARDETLGSAIKRIGYLKRETNLEPFKSLIQQIIAQQISKEAAQTVFARFLTISNDCATANLYTLDLEKIKACGMSYRKAEYILNLIEFHKSNKLDFDSLKKASNQEVIDTLTQVKGIGLWSAQMFLIFTLERNDVIAYDDLAIRKGIMKLYNLEKLSKKDFKLYEQRYNEYASVASIYLWYLAHNDL